MTVLQFDGNRDRVKVPYSADLNPESLTISVWAKVMGSANTWRSPVTSRDDWPQRGYIIYAGIDNLWQFWIGNGSGWTRLVGPAVVLNEWVHVAGTYDKATKTATMYVNGQKVAETTSSYALNTLKVLLIGGGASERDPGDYWFNGQVGEVRLWNRALSAAEIQASMTTRPGANEPGLVGYWPCEEASGTVVANQAGTPGSHAGNMLDNASWSTDQNPVPRPRAALDLDGTNDFVRLPAGTYFKGDFTIEAWVCVKKISFWGSLVDFTSKEGGGDNQVALYLSSKTSGKPGIAVQGAGGVSEHTNLDCDSALTLNRWTHIAATLSGTTGSFYIDGVKVNATIRDPGGKVLTAMARPADVVRSYAAIGRPTWFPNEALGNMKIDELRIWSVARTPEQIVANMNRELGAEQDLVAYYKFNEGRPDGDNSAIAGGQEIKDSAGGHHGTMNGFAKTGASSNWVASPTNLK